MVALLTSVRNSPCFGGLRRTKTCHRQLFARPSVFLRYFLHAAKSTNPFSLSGVPRFCEPRFSAQNYNFPLTKLKPSQRKIRGSANLESAHKTKTSHEPNEILCRSAAYFRLTAAPLRLRRFLGGYAAFVTFLRKVCPCRDGTLRVLLSAALPPFWLPAATDRRSAASHRPLRGS